jgi:ribonuclease HII
MNLTVKHSQYILGIDEAGRGPVIGPMVIAGIRIVKDVETVLAKIGVKDSKKLSPSKRNILFNQIKQIVNRSYIIIIYPNTIDKFVSMKSRPGGLNFLEAKAMSKIISKIKSDIVYVDAVDIRCDRFCNWIKMNVTDQDFTLIGEHNADSTYPVVSAASIVAKVIRDREIMKLNRIYGDFGSGYASDKRTIRFLKQYYLENHMFPSIVRKTWKTLKRLENT